MYGSLTFHLVPPVRNLGLQRCIDRFPFVPDDPSHLDQDCYEAFNIQVSGLAKRLEATGTAKICIGVSGGLDSAHALIVAAKVFDLLGRPRTDILGFTMPGFGTSARTKSNAYALMNGLGVTVEEIDIKPLAQQMLQDLRHPFARGEPVYDTTFENVQAGLRTDLLFRATNQRNGMVLGTGNMSELALGWCTYGVGDQMSHYNVNGSLPKTLIQHLVRWTAANRLFDPAVSDVLLDILATTISPELIPQTAEGESQSTEGKIGPYELHDFWIYYLTRFGLRPSKIAFLALHAWRDTAAGHWPPGFPDEQKRAYPIGAIRSWLEVFLQRFFANQFKRSALPNGPKVTTGGSLSPRGDWRMPSDAHGQVWIDELHRNVPEVLDPASDDIPTKEPKASPVGGKPIVR